MRRSATITILLFIAASQLNAAPNANKPITPRVIPPAIEHKGGHDKQSILIRYKPSTPASDRAAAQARVKASVLRESRLVPGLQHWALAPGMTPERAARILNKLPFVEYAHPDYIIHLDQTPPDDEYWLEQWGMNNTGQASLFGAFPAGVDDADIDWPEANLQATGAGVVVAVLDTGVDYRHTDIGPNVWLNEAELTGTDGVDDDGNGYIDDVRGWDFANDDPFPLDGHGHGTMVAGIIAAVTSNTKGVAGVMPDGEVMALKAFADDGTGLLSDAIEALEYAVNKGVRISNNSWGYSDYLPEEEEDHNALYDAIAAAGIAGHLFVASAGNDSSDTDLIPHYPSSFGLDNIVSVGATNNADELAWFSSFGLISVDVSAPGDLIMSTYKLFAGQFEDYAWESGTSFSAPFVSGVAGLVMELQPGWTDQQIKARLMDTARPSLALAGKSATGGIVNAQTALAGLPEAVVDIDVLPGDPANIVFPNKSGELPVAVLGSPTFDATQVDPATLAFGAAAAAPVGPVTITNVDGLYGDDTVADFEVGEVGILCNDTEVTVSGSTYAGQSFTGTDSIDATQCETGCHAY